MENEPALSLSGLSIWIDGRQSPQSKDYWDANWLNLRVRMQSEGATVECIGAILTTAEIDGFRTGLKALYKNLTGSAELAGLEPNLKITLTATPLGQIHGVVEITPDHLSQFHRFEVGTDQSYLPDLIQSLDRILDDFPVLYDKHR